MITSRRTRGALGCALVLATVGACSKSSPTATPPPSSPHHSSSSNSQGPATSSPSQGPATSSPSRGPATEFHPPGDISDSTVYVDHVVPGSKVHVKVPEGWANSSHGGTTTYTDSFNSISIQVVKSSKPSTVASATKIAVPRLRKTTTKFSPGTVTTVQRTGGRAVLITYFVDSAQDPVTGKVVRDAVERYLFWHNGQEAILTLTGPKTADNVDPWRVVSDSVHWQ